MFRLSRPPHILFFILTLNACRACISIFNRMNNGEHLDEDTLRTAIDFASIFFIPIFGISRGLHIFSMLNVFAQQHRQQALIREIHAVRLDGPDSLESGIGRKLQ